MTKNEFVTTRVAVGLYPHLVIAVTDLLPLYQKLVAFPEFNGFSTFSPPQSFTPIGTTAGTLTSSDNVLKCEISQTAVSLTWANITHAAHFDIEPNTAETLVARITEAISQEIGGVAQYREFVVNAPKATMESIFVMERQKGLKSFSATLTYPGGLRGFKDLDVIHTVTDNIPDDAWTVAFPEHKYSLSGNTSMRYEADRILTMDQIKKYVVQALTEQTGEKMLADITDGGE